MLHVHKRSFEYFGGGCSPNIAPAKIVQYLKGRSSKLIQDEFNDLKKKY